MLQDMPLVLQRLRDAVGLASLSLESSFPQVAKRESLGYALEIQFQLCDAFLGQGQGI